MAKLKTDIEIQTELDAMNEMRPKLANAMLKSERGNLRLFDIQRTILQQRWDGFDVQDHFGYPTCDVGENILSAAHEAVLWMDGKSKYKSLATDYPVGGLLGIE